MRLLYGASFLLLAALVFAGPDNAHIPTRKHRAVDGHLRHRRGPSSKCPARKSPAPPAPSPAPAPARTGCFPSLKFKMPDNVPDASVLPNQWWCNQGSEYAFLGFSYSVALCQSRSQLTREFSDIRNRFKGRYVRLYGACDRKGFYNDVVEAAWSAGIGVHALIWFGFDGSGIWKTRRDALFAALHSNPKAKFVTRVVQFGSEPLYDHVLPPATLASQVNAAKAALADLHIPVTVSDMAHGYEIHGGAQPVVNAVSFFDVHVLPFFSPRASTGKNAWPLVLSSIQWFLDNGKGKKIVISQNGWPSVTSPGVRPNGPAVASVQNERDYFHMLDSHCADFKRLGGGIGWFAHLYSESQGTGYGILDGSGRPKFSFSPRTSC